MFARTRKQVSVLSDPTVHWFCHLESMDSVVSGPIVSRCGTTRNCHLDMDSVVSGSIVSRCGSIRNR
jgi:hypothetical protein|uniref:Uncharacterized protein n=1 Tax=Zea mays TaxID=4577 RepID=B4FC37_MAIZE|nr:unknown [Zea mays]